MGPLAVAGVQDGGKASLLLGQAKDFAGEQPTIGAGSSLDRLSLGAHRAWCWEWSEIVTGPNFLSTRGGPRDSDTGGTVLSRLTKMSVRNYRALADVQLELRPINVVFGPNGAGKSTLLDSLYFFRDCAIRGVEVASSERDHGIGILWDGALEDGRVSVEIADDNVSYKLSVSLSAGRIDPFPGERLVSAARPAPLIGRNPGADKATLYHTEMGASLAAPCVNRTSSA